MEYSQAPSLLADVMETDKVFQNFQVDADFPSIGRRTFVLNARKMTAPGDGNRSLILLAMEEIMGSEKQI